MNRKLGPLAMLALLAGPLLSMVDSSVVNVAVPDISRSLHGSLDTIQWTVSGYLLALAAILPATSFLAKRFGTVRVYAVSLAAFTGASVLCALAHTLPELVAARALQGAVGAPLVPLSMSLTLGGDRRNLPTSAGVVLFLGPALGPTVGGLLVSAWGWPAIFLVNAPIGLAALLALPRLARHGIVDTRDASARFDPFGLALLSVGLAAALYGASEGPTHGWWSARSGPFWLSGLLLLLGYGLWARRRPYPAVDLRLLRHPRSALALWLCTVASVVTFSVLFLLPVLVQTIQGHGALASGLVLLPQGIVMGLSTKWGMTLGERGWLRPLVLLGLLAVGTTTALLLLVDANTPLWTVAALMAGRGLGIGMVIQPLLLAMLAGLGRDQMADANTLFNVAQRLGGSIGVGLLATFFTLRVTSHVGAVLGTRSVPAAGSGTGGAGLASAPPALRPALVHAALAGFHDTILVATGIAFLGAVCALFVRRPGTGQPDPEPTGRPSPAAQPAPPPAAQPSPAGGVAAA
jgi:EmrB/QacA subfamily drug resistance transporter